MEWMKTDTMDDEIDMELMSDDGGESEEEWRSWR
jgi:hypothetical protein